MAAKSATLTLVPSGNRRDSHISLQDHSTDGDAVAGMLDEIGAWKVHLRQEDKSKHTVRLYELGVRKLAAHLAGRADGWQDVTKRQVEAFLVSLRDQGLSDGYRQSVFFGCKSFLGWLEDEGAITASPMHRMKSKKVQAPPVPVLETEELAAITAACRAEKDPYIRLRDEAIIRVLADCGLRLHECSQLRRDGLARLPVIQVTGKGGKVRDTLAGSKTVAILRRYLRARDRRPDAASLSLWLGLHGAMSDSGIYKIVRSRSAQAGLDVHPHMFRHAWAHEYLSSGGQVNNLVTLAGWSSYAMAMRYGASAATRRALADASQRPFGDRF